MPKTILVLSTQYPGYGGAATNSYAIIKFLRTMGYDTYGVFFENGSRIIVDPDRIGNILSMKYGPVVCHNKRIVLKYRAMIDKLMGKQPDVILCKNYIAPLCSKILYPNVKNIYLVAGLVNIIDMCTDISVKDLLTSNTFTSNSQEEINAFDHSDLVVTNSQITLDLLLKSYPSYAKKFHSVPIDTSQYIAHLISDVDEPLPKKYDLLVTSSILTRKEKNNLFLIDILKDPLLKPYTKLIIGQNNLPFKSIPNSTVKNLLPHSDLMHLMKSTKVLLYPSLYDSSPNTIREAVINNCLVLTTPNVGYSEKFPDVSICQTYDHDEWISKILYLVQNYDQLIGTYDIDFGSSNNDLISLIENFIS